MNRTKELLLELNDLRLKPKGRGPDAAVRRLEMAVEILTELVELEGTQQLRKALTEAERELRSADRFYRRKEEEEDD